MNIFKHKLMLTALVLSAVLWSTVASADNIYLRYIYKDIKGDVTDPGYEDTIGIDSFSWGLSRPVSFVVGGGGGAGAAESAEVVLTKLLDSSSTKLAVEALIGKGEAVKIEFAQTGGPGLQTYMELELCNAYVTSLSTTSGGERPSEDLGLVFEAFKLTYTSFDLQGIPGSPVDTGWWSFSTNSPGGGPC